MAEPEELILEGAHFATQGRARRVAALRSARCGSSDPAHRRARSAGDVPDGPRSRRPSRSRRWSRPRRRAGSPAWPAALRAAAATDRCIRPPTADESICRRRFRRRRAAWTHSRSTVSLPWNRPRAWCAGRRWCRRTSRAARRSDWFLLAEAAAVDRWIARRGPWAGARVACGACVRAREPCAVAARRRSIARLKNRFMRSSPPIP